MGPPTLRYQGNVDGTFRRALSGEMTETYSSERKMLMTTPNDATMKEIGHFGVFTRGGEFSFETSLDTTPCEDCALLDPDCLVTSDRSGAVIRITFLNADDRLVFTLPFDAARKLGAILIAETCIHGT